MLPKTDSGVIEGWTRATRTDKKVHAVANLIGCKLNVRKEFIDFDKGVEEPLDKIRHTKYISFDRIVAAVNDKLPKNIRIFAM